MVMSLWLCCRTGDVTLHQQQSDFAEKNEFLQDLDKQDVSEILASKPRFR